MSRLFFDLTKLAVLSLALQISACTAEQPETTHASGALAEVPAVCIRTIQEYVTRSRGWPRNDYVILNERGGGGRKGFSIWHNDDKGFRPPGGGGKSFHVELNEKCEVVLDELGYQ